MAQEVFLLSILNEYMRMSVFRVGGSCYIEQGLKEHVYSLYIYTNTESSAQLPARLLSKCACCQGNF